LTPPLAFFQQEGDKDMREAYIEQANSALQAIMNDDSFHSFQLFIPIELRNNFVVMCLDDVVMAFFNNLDDDSVELYGAASVKKEASKIIKALKKCIVDMVKISEQIDAMLEVEAK
jgi:hypothetical protein